uniref:Uncharacterized protein n=1 Tax=Strombidium rassoulzadegani TaxID=1082188 RepID=A0A7S3CK39_9SPIT|mmetsp:Transcript_13948/g.23723  ORF Transcript_13948/g.23723 Transcript_13948/m.23723 type:complete len:149 (+) Transcript_13948:589-1035(+)
MKDEGYLVEFPNAAAHEHIKRDHNRSKQVSILYPVGIDEEPQVEVRGSKSTYKQESLHLLSLIWNDADFGLAGGGSKNKKQTWMDVIEQNRLLEDDEDHTQFLYRKDLMLYNNQEDEDQNQERVRRSKKVAQKNVHLQDIYDFTTDYN